MFTNISNIINNNICALIRCCGGTGSIVSIHNALYAGVLNKVGTPEQKSQFLPNFISKGIVGCFALSEPGNYFKTYTHNFK